MTSAALAGSVPTPFVNMPVKSMIKATPVVYQQSSLPTPFLSAP